MRGLSGVLVTVLGVRPAKKRSVGCFAVFGIRSVDRCVDSREFWLPSWAVARQRSVLSGVLRFSVSAFSRKMRGLSGVLVTVLGSRPTKKHSVGCFALFGIRSVDRCVDSRVFRLPSWTFARQRSVLSGVLRFSVSVQSTDQQSVRTRTTQTSKGCLKNEAALACLCCVHL